MLSATGRAGGTRTPGAAATRGRARSVRGDVTALAAAAGLFVLLFPQPREPKQWRRLRLRRRLPAVSAGERGL